MRNFKVTTNNAEKTATIYVYDDNKLSVKYRTNELSRDEFEQFEYMTQNDIANYLRTSGDYYEVK